MRCAISSRRGSPRWLSKAWLKAARRCLGMFRQVGPY
jgi:hypothetical protein